MAYHHAAISSMWYHFTAKTPSLSEIFHHSSIIYVVLLLQKQYHLCDAFSLEKNIIYVIHPVAAIVSPKWYSPLWWCYKSSIIYAIQFPIAVVSSMWYILLQVYLCSSTIYVIYSSVTVVSSKWYFLLQKEYHSNKTQRGKYYYSEEPFAKEGNKRERNTTEKGYYERKYYRRKEYYNRETPCWNRISSQKN